MAGRLATAVFTLGCMHSSVVAALGLGELKLDSFLNEPLSASVNLLNTGGLHEDQIRVRLATSEDFKRLGLDRAYFLTSIKFEIEIDDQGNGKIVLTSEDPVLEPYLDFLIEARWPSGRLLREYTVLVDPPAFDSDSPAVSASTRVAETEGGATDATKKKTAAATSGTQVSTARSDLGAGQMPDRSYGAEASASPLAGDKYLIRRDETLWGIAERARPDGTSVHQTMLDIQRLNPDAFIDGNINKIKAGYVIYLPASGDISSDDLASAEAEVNKQNEDWRESRDRDTESGPSLRISADPVDESGGSSIEESASVASSVASDQAVEQSRENVELSERLAAMEDQVATLERIVSLKDNQISALQKALADPDSEQDEAASDLDAVDSLLGDESAMEEPLEGEESDMAAPDLDEASGVDDATEISQEEYGSEPESVSEPEPVVAAAEPSEAETPVAKPAPKPAPKPVAKPKPEEGGGWLVYGLGLLAAVGAGAFVFLRRRKAANDDSEELESVSEAAFADVELQDSEVDLETVEELESDFEEAIEAEAGDTTEDGESEDSVGGYGERKHDEYASDEAGDALAEADIYIAYGRYPQAVELLKTAINNEPRTAAYRVKLLELAIDMGDREEAQEQYAELQSMSDAAAISRAENLLRNAENGNGWLEDIASPGAAEFASTGGELLSEDELTADSGEALEADFGELEIEPIDLEAGEDDLDLSADFVDDDDDEDEDGEGDDEEFVFAEGGSEMSTKLDLARAYLDMGDEDGAREILQEVAREGSANEAEEAGILLDRLG